MSYTSRSPRKVIAVALAIGRQSLPDFVHPCSPKTFTQPQLLACLALMVCLRTDYRGIEVLLHDLPALRHWIGLKRTPDHSTLHRAAQRLFGTSITQRLLAASLRLAMGRRKIVRLAAADSTGLETGHRSAYFVRRRQRGQSKAKNPLYLTTTYTRFPKLTLLADCHSHLILALLTGAGPRSDINELQPLMGQLPPGLTLRKLLADAGFDSESNHLLMRQEHGIQSLMPARHGRPAKHGKPPSGHWRRRMRRLLRSKRQRRRSGYTQRWQVETVVSMIKRNLGEALSGQSYHARNRQMRLRALVHNIMILLFIEGFATEQDWYDILDILRKPGHSPQMEKRSRLAKPPLPSGEGWGEGASPDGEGRVCLTLCVRTLSSGPSRTQTRPPAAWFSKLGHEDLAPATQPGLRPRKDSAPATHHPPDTRHPIPDTRYPIPDTRYPIRSYYIELGPPG